MADAGRDEADRTGGKEVWTWLGLVKGWRVKGGAGWVTDIMEESVIPMGDGGVERFDMAKERSGGFA